MRWTRLYLRSRHAPAALLAVTAATALMWTLWSVFAETRTAEPQLVVLTVLLLVAVVTATLGGPDDALEKTAALRWPPRRAAHLLAAFAVVAVLLLATLLTGARFGPAGLVVRDTAGLLGLTALGAATVGPSRSWFAPLGWTLAATAFPQSDSALGRSLTWQTQAPTSTAAATVAGLLALAGLLAYTLAGPAPKAPAEAAQA